MKELKIFAVVAAFSLVLYWGVEPFAHGQMYKHVEGNDLVYDGKDDIAEAKAKGDKDRVVKKEKFWKEVAEIAKIQGDPKAGETGFAMCMGCHMDGAPNMGGVTPPPLDHAGAIYDKNYLIALIKDPAMASNVDHKYADTMMHPMGSVKSMFADNKAIADVVAYIKKAKSAEPTPKIAYQEACMRCHANRYGKLTQLGEIPKFKTDIMTGHSIAELDYKKKVAQEQKAVANYLGKLPPDLSIIYRARSESFLETLIENPQAQLAGTAMPRVGLNKQGMEKVMTYLQETGDPSKPKREELGPWVLGFFFIFTILAYLWKQSHWRDLH